MTECCISNSTDHSVVSVIPAQVLTTEKLGLMSSRIGE